MPIRRYGRRRCFAERHVGGRERGCSGQWRSGAADATAVDGVPALPADTIGSSRAAQPKEPDEDQAAGSKAADQPPRRLARAELRPAVRRSGPSAAEDPTIAYLATPLHRHVTTSRVRPRYRPSASGLPPGSPARFGRSGGQPPGSGRAAVGLPGRVRVGDARPAAALAVVPGAHVPAVRYDRQEPAAASRPGRRPAPGQAGGGRARPRRAAQRRGRHPRPSRSGRHGRRISPSPGSSPGR